MHRFGIWLFLLFLGGVQHAAGNPTQCQDMCADPHIDHGSVINPDVDDHVFHHYDYYQLFHNDTNVAVQCDYSYWFTGTSQRNGTIGCRVENCEARWDPSEREACRAVECGPVPFYGGVLKHSTDRLDLPCTGTDLDAPITANKSACLVCHPGFKIMEGDHKLDGPIRVRCRPDGSWDAHFHCKNQIDCQRPSTEDLSRRFLQILSFDARDQIEFECTTDDFLMFGDPVVRCQNGNWSLPLPVCRFKWSCLLSISKGSVIRIPTARPPLGPWARNNDYGVAHCKPGYTISSTGDGRIKCNKGNWDPQPICLAPCDAPPEIVRARKPENRTYTNNERYRYSCNRGYERRGGTSLYRCDGVNKQWVPLGYDTRLMTCERVSCGRPRRIPNTVVTLEAGNTFFGSRAIYRCDVGYKKTRGILSYIVCLHNKKWTVISMRCDVVTCPALTNPANGEVEIVGGTTGRYDYESEYKYSCDYRRGFRLKGKQIRETIIRTCTADGSWSYLQDEPECERSLDARAQRAA